MGNLGISGAGKATPIQPTEAPKVHWKPDPADEDYGAMDGWRGLDYSFSATYSAGRLKGAQTYLAGGRIESGHMIAENQFSSLWLIGDANAAVGNGLLLGLGGGLRGEIGGDHANVFATVAPRLNGGISTNGLTGGIGVRAAAGAHVGDFFGEVAHEVGTNIRMTSVSVGVRARF